MFDRADDLAFAYDRLEPGVSPPPSDPSSLAGLISERIGASYSLPAPDLATASSDGGTLVDEVVVIAPDKPRFHKDFGGGGSGTSPTIGPSGGGGGFGAVVTYAEGQAQAYVAAHLTVDVDLNDPTNRAVYEAVYNTLANLYFQAAGFFFQSLDGPGAYDTSPNELKASLQNIHVTLTNTYVGGTGALTTYVGAQANIGINPQTVMAQGYQTAFGQAAGMNYPIYHELGHGMSDTITFYTANGGAQMEQFANTYAYALAHLVGDAIPTLSQMSLVGGTLPF